MPARFSSLLTLLFAFCSFLFLSGCGDGGNLIDRWNSPLGYGCCGLIILVMDIIAIIQVVGSGRSTTSKLLWILLIIVFPVLGFFLYFFFADR